MLEGNFEIIVINEDLKDVGNLILIFNSQLDRVEDGQIMEDDN